MYLQPIYFKLNETLALNATEGLEEDPVFCAFYNPDFIIYSSLGSFYIPCLVMIVLYFRIFKVFRQTAKYKIITSTL